uniref:Uncharacterized protein n=1 Tax=Oryza punctata TaxID=4537 RepID=A0A0E0L0V1_ORYPU
MCQLIKKRAPVKTESSLSFLSTRLPLSLASGILLFLIHSLGPPLSPARGGGALPTHKRKQHDGNTNGRSSGPELGGCQIWRSRLSRSSLQLLRPSVSTPSCSDEMRPFVLEMPTVLIS